MNTITGKVISTKMQNTIVVRVDRLVAHPKYGKRIRKTFKFHAHCDLPVKVGDLVTIAQTRPISKTKHWTVVGGNLE